MATLRLVPVSGPAIDDVKDPSMVGRDPSCEIVVTDGSVSRWSFHTACIDPNAPADARNRKNVVVRAFVFF